MCVKWVDHMGAWNKITQMKLTTFKYIYAMSKARILLLYYFIQDLQKFNTDISVISVT